MKKLFIEMRKKFNEKDLDLSILDRIKEKKISLAATIQYIDLISVVKKYFEKKGKKVLIRKGAKYEGHVIGCDSSAFDNEGDVFLLIADGKFHAINNAIQLEKEIYVFNGMILNKVERREIEKQKQIILGKKKKFLSADVIGVICSAKKGQKNDSIREIKNRIENLGKEVFLFECDNVDFLEFENFPQVEIWVNTACFGLARDDRKIINLCDILEFLN